jgi:hypothetical protein
VNLVEKQKCFANLVAALITEAQRRGYGVTLGECWRTPEEAKRNAEEGDGIVHSLHILRLAIDINLWLDSKWLSRDEDYLSLGEWWEKQSFGSFIKCCWGGRFQKGDGCHFSIEHKGVR